MAFNSIGTRLPNTAWPDQIHPRELAKSPPRGRKGEKGAMTAPVMAPTPASMRPTGEAAETGPASSATESELADSTGLGFEAWLGGSLSSSAG